MTRPVSEQLPTQCRQGQLTGLDAAAGSRPYNGCARGYSWMREPEPAEQDTVILGQDDRPDGPSQPHRGGRFVHMRIIREPVTRLQTGDGHVYKYRLLMPRTVCAQTHPAVRAGPLTQ